MKVISLFSGAGGLDLGFALAGHEIVWGNDFDKDAVHTYKHNFPRMDQNEIVLGDITDLLPNHYHEIDEFIPDGDIVIGGFPCQGFSIANIDRNMKDERNYLYLELLKVIEAKKPPFFLLENVKGLENMEKGQILKMILNDLESAGQLTGGQGYTVYYNVFNALDFGVPQNRERVIILGINNDLKDTFKMPLAEIGDPIQNNDWKRLYLQSTHAEDGSTGEAYLPHEKIEVLYNKWKQNQLNFTEDYFEHSYEVPYKYTNLKDAIADLPENYLASDTDEIYNHYGTLCKVKLSNRVGNRPTHWDRPSPTIMGRGSGTGGPLIIPHPLAHRRMSIREVARIQTFPDEFMFKGSNSSCYRQIGNAVPVLMAYHIAKQIFPMTTPNLENNTEEKFEQTTLFV